MIKPKYDPKEAENERKVIERPVSGGYVCQIKTAVDNETAERIECEFEIVEGKYKGYAAEMNENYGFCPLHFVKSYKASADFYFKKFCIAIDDTNKTSFFEDYMEKRLDEKKLINKGIGILLQKVIKTNPKTGKDSTYYQVADFVSAADIRNGNFTVPGDIDKRGEEAQNPFSEIPASEDDGTLPF